MGCKLRLIEKICAIMFILEEVGNCLLFKINMIGYFLIELTNLSYNQIGQIIGINDRCLAYSIKQRFNRKK